MAKLSASDVGYLLDELDAAIAVLEKMPLTNGEVAHANGTAIGKLANARRIVRFPLLRDLELDAPQTNGAGPRTGQLPGAGAPVRPAGCGLLCAPLGPAWAVCRGGNPPRPGRLVSDARW